MRQGRRSNSGLHVMTAWVEDRLEVRRWQPPSPERVFVSVVVEIGRVRDEGFEYFTIQVASPQALAELAESGDDLILAGPHLLVVRRWDADALYNWLDDTVQSCEAETWELSVERLRRFFRYGGA